MSIEFLIGGNLQTQVHLSARTANRHGMIAGATGTGKTVTLQLLTEGFSKIGVPVFLADVKGDLSGLAIAGQPHEKIQARIDMIKIKDFTSQANPCLFWDLLAKQGHPVHTTISEMGPLLLSSLLELNEVQSGILYAAFSIADDNGMLLLDLKDLRSMLSWMGKNSKNLSNDYGNISNSSIGAIQRRLLILEQQGGENLFAEPVLKLNDLMITDFSGRGVISIMDVTKLINDAPRVYASFLIWLLAELYEQLPEVGDAEKPKIVLFFDEAHLLFDRAPRSLVDKIEQVVRLIRSKGVGVYFISQSPLDIPEDIMGQLGTKIQHALRAFTPKDKKTVKMVADTFRENPQLDTRTVITELKTGEALVSVLSEDGSPTPVERILIAPPGSRIGPLSDTERQDVINRSPLKGRYDEKIDRESAYEILKKRAEQEKQLVKPVKESSTTKQSRTSNRQSYAESITKSVLRSLGSSLGRQIVRGIMKTILGK
ncbi:MAG: ATP-binding protein [Gammaproteobacteria bacterium]|nr:MAG: ATP-binding protein [Gammaproteobacteria bacterium]